MPNIMQDMILNSKVIEQVPDLIMDYVDKLLKEYNLTENSAILLLILISASIISLVSVLAVFYSKNLNIALRLGRARQNFY